MTKPSILGRGVYLVRRLWRLAPLAGGPIKAAQLIWAIRRSPQDTFSIIYSGRPVRFRATDEQALYEVFTDQEYAFAAHILKGNHQPTVLDIGAHIGTFATWVLSINPHARIVSLEADPETYAIIHENSTLPSNKESFWHVLHGAAGEDDGAMIGFSVDGPSMGHRANPLGRVKVGTISLPSLIAEAVPEGGRIDLMKIDIEGSEESFIRGGSDALRHISNLIIELHPGFCDTTYVRDVLEEHFSIVEQIEGRVSSKPLLFCREPRAE